MENKKEDRVQKQIENAFQEGFSYLMAAETFLEICPMFYDKSKLWWIWDNDNFYWKNIDEIDILNAYSKATGMVSITKGKVKSQVITALQMKGRDNHPKEAKIKYIQFKDKVINIEDNKTYPVENRFFFTNPIPWEIGETDETPTMDKLFEEWVGKDYVETLYEIIAYCCLRDYPIQVLFCFIGGGRNGKSCFQRIIDKFIGNNNVCTSDLDLLAGKHRNRFESFKLYKKLVCQVGETDFGILNNTGILKRLTGGDKISYEKKRADPFDDYSYAKIVISTNSLPSSDDTSEGYYRRWIIVDFPNKFPEGNDIVKTIPDIEYNNLCNKIIKKLPQLLESGSFMNQGSIEERKDRYIDASNPLPKFIDKFCERDGVSFVRYSELYSAYAYYLSNMKRRVVSRKEFGQFLDGEGLEKHNTSKNTGKVDGAGYPIKESGWYVEGLSLIDDWKKVIDGENTTNTTNTTQNVTRFLSIDSNKKKSGICGICATEEKVSEVIESPVEPLVRFKEVLNDLGNVLSPIPIGEVVKTCSIYDIDEVKVDSLIEHFKKKGMLFEPKSGFVQMM